MSDGPQLGIGEILANRFVRRLSIAQFVSLFGDFLALFAVFNIVSFRLNGSPAAIGSITIAYMLPQACTGPLAGVFVDRWNVKRAMIASDLVRAVLVIALVYATKI